MRQTLPPCLGRFPYSPHYGPVREVQWSSPRGGDPGDVSPSNPAHDPCHWHPGWCPRVGQGTAHGELLQPHPSAPSPGHTAAPALSATPQEHPSHPVSDITVPLSPATSRLCRPAVPTAWGGHGRSCFPLLLMPGSAPLQVSGRGRWWLVSGPTACDGTGSTPSFTHQETRRPHHPHGGRGTPCPARPRLPGPSAPAAMGLGSRGLCS